MSDERRIVSKNDGCDVFLLETYEGVRVDIGVKDLWVQLVLSPAGARELSAWLLEVADESEAADAVRKAEHEKWQAEVAERLANPPPKKPRVKKEKREW